MNNANPNGDPLNGNRPRINYDGSGELSDVCIKRKIRNRLMETGYAIFVQSDDNRVDDYRSLRARAEGELKNVDMNDDEKYHEAACKKWIDVRSFGQVFAYKEGSKKGKAAREGSDGGEDIGVSTGIRRAVSIHPAFSVAPVQLKFPRWRFTIISELSVVWTFKVGSVEPISVNEAAKEEANTTALEIRFFKALFVMAFP